MNMLSPAEMLECYAEAGPKKAERPIGKMFLLSVAAGVLVALGGAATSAAVHAVSNAGMAKMICGLLFPFGLGMVMLLGAELFTGNCMIPVSVLEKKTTLSKMLVNWIVVYCGNFAGGLLTAAGCAFCGQLGLSGGDLAVYTVKVAAVKCAIPFFPGIVLGFFCNVLVCAGVLCSLSAKDTAGRIMGAYIPTAFFVICGFEHCIANMYYIPAGLFAMNVPEYAALAAEAGINTEPLNWQAFFTRNLLPVTIGNILGGVSIGLVLWAGHLRKSKTEQINGGRN